MSFPELRQARRDIGPAIEPVPGEVEIARGVVLEIRNPEPRQDALEIAPMQHVELAERNAAGAHLFHAGLVFAAPRIGEGEPVKRMSPRLENALGLTRDAGTPVDQRAEHVEEQRPDRHGVPLLHPHDPAGSMPLDLSTSAAAGPESVLSNALAASLSLPLAPSPAA